MRLLISFGPSYEPIDGARRLTNMSTGRLGLLLANAFTDAGWEVHCLRGEGSTFHAPLATPRVEAFSTNADLAARFERLAGSHSFDAVFHAAALCDFRVVKAVNASGETLHSPKIATRDGRLLLELEPATKVLPRLRGWFPKARLVGWKYELAGTADDAIERARRQIRECRTDACVVNGAAYGNGFAICTPDGGLRPTDDIPSLASELLCWLGETRDPSERRL